MKVAFCLFSIFVIQAFGRILSPFDKEWQEYGPYQNTIDILDSLENKNELDSQNLSFENNGKSVYYYLYTRESPDPYEITKDDASLLNDSTFDPSKKTKVLVHGYLNGYNSPMEQEVLDAYLANQDVNIVAVDWSEFAAPYYNIAVDNTLSVGKDIALLIDFLVSAGGASVADIHIIGHSLGAHVSAFAANHVTSGRITRISGLDPALPSFGDRPPARRLDPLDADVVDCIHTCGKYLGFYDPLCTHDFYPNGGAPVQPGCGFDWYGSCSHARSFKFFAASIAYNFSAQACDSFLAVKVNKCTGDWTGLMGELAPTAPAGLYYLETKSSYPYVE